MLHAANELKGLNLDAKDGHVGTVEEDFSRPMSGCFGYGMHFTGMFVTTFLILMVDDPDDSRLHHKISGPTTLAALAGAMVVVTF